MTTRDNYGLCPENCLKSGDEAINFHILPILTFFIEQTRIHVRSLGGKRYETNTIPSHGGCEFADDCGSLPALFVHG
jgi:hypothetical protein